MDRHFSRTWRRNKCYTQPELRWLARKRGLEFSARRGKVQIVNPKTGKIEANFAEIAPVMEIMNSNELERKRLFAALSFGKGA